VSAAAAGGVATVLPFRRRSAAAQGLDDKVELALTAVAARHPAAAGDLYDLVSRPLYSLVRAITHDDGAAQEATVAAFAEIWATSGRRPEGAGTSWVMEVACRCARSARLVDARADVPPATDRLHLVDSA